MSVYRALHCYRTDGDFTKRHAADFKVTLLGTGTPVLNVERFGMSTLVEAGGQRTLV